MSTFSLSIILFVIAYFLIITEWVHRSVVAFAFGTIAILLGVINQEQAVMAIDFNTIWLLMAMMVLVAITRHSGVFEYMAVKSAKMVKGKPLAILIMYAVVTAVISAFLDNVTTVLLMVPVTFSITEKLKVNPIPFIIAQIIASNIGGTATLVGDPPNIMIGSALGLSFMDFVANLAAVNMVILLATAASIAMIYRRQLHTSGELIAEVMHMDERACIVDAVLLKKSLGVLALTIAGFLLHGVLGLESATVAMAGAALLLLISGADAERAFHAVEWPTIIFFAGLFVIIGGLEASGVIRYCAENAMALTGGSIMKTGMLVLWFSAFASAIVDNIPFVATMIPLLQEIGQLTGMPMDSIWWALSLGACLGGNGTLIGASANVVVAGMAEKNGYPVTFMSYLKIGLPMMILSIAIGSVYMYLFYWM